MNNILLKNLPILDVLLEESCSDSSFNNEEEILILFDILNLKNNDYYLNLCIDKLSKNSEMLKLNVGTSEERKIILRHVLLNKIFNDKIN